MFDKRLIKEIPEAKAYVKRQVLCQWIALIMNIIFTVGLSYTLVLLFQEQLTIEILMIGICFRNHSFCYTRYCFEESNSIFFCWSESCQKNIA